MSKLIGNILIDIIPLEHSWKIKLLNSWDSIIGKLKNKVRIEKITDSSVTLGVCHATWAQELFFLSPVLKDKINGVLQEEKIKTIKFQTVKFSTQTKKEKQMAEETQTNKRNSHKQHREHCLTITEHNTLKAITNSELAQTLELFCIRCKKYNQPLTESHLGYHNHKE